MTIEHTATVIESREGRVRVRIAGPECCGSCGACTRGSKPRSVEAVAADPIGVSVGDVVVVRQSGAHPLRDAFLLFVLPIILLLAGYIAGDALGHTAAGVILGALLAVPPVVFLRLGEARRSERFHLINRAATACHS
jgi:sigma-E factor negative regulatory protein RseC